MTQGFFLTGTDTDVGKTYAAVRLIRRWQAEGRRVAAMKPVASGSVRRPDGGLVNGDVAALVQAGQKGAGECGLPHTAFLIGNRNDR